MTVGLRLCSPARPLFPASLPVRVPTVESLSSALSFAPSRFLTSRLTTVAVIDSVGNSHPDRIGTCRAHERGRSPPAARRSAEVVWSIPEPFHLLCCCGPGRSAVRQWRFQDAPSNREHWKWDLIFDGPARI